MNITFIDLLKILYKKKISLIILSLVFGAIFAAYSLTLENTYRSYAVLKPSNDGQQTSNSSFSGFGSVSVSAIPIFNSGNEKTKYAMELARSRIVVKNLAEIDGVLENIFALKKVDPSNFSISYNKNIYDPEKEQWTRSPPKGRKVKPSHIELHQIITEKLVIEEDRDNGYLKVYFDHQSPLFAKQFLDLLIQEINETARLADLKLATDSLIYLQKRLDTTVNREIRDSIGDLIESQLRIQMIANVSTNYLVVPIDPPQVAEIKHSPRRTLITLIGILIGLTLSSAYYLYPSLRKE